MDSPHLQDLNQHFSPLSPGPGHRKHTVEAFCLPVSDPPFRRHRRILDVVLATSLHWTGFSLSQPSALTALWSPGKRLQACFCILNDVQINPQPQLGMKFILRCQFCWGGPPILDNSSNPDCFPAILFWTLLPQVE